MATIAKSESFCTCGARIEIGEEVPERHGGSIHLGCPERTANSVTKPTVTESYGSGFLFDAAGVETVENASATIGVSHLRFDGATLLGVDVPRLAGQLAKVYTLMSDGKFRTLEQIAEAAGCLETSASARLRDLRKPKFGGHQIISRHVGNGVHEYKLILSPKEKANARRAA